MEKLMELIKERNFSQLRRELEEMNVVDIAEFLSEMSKEDSILVFRILHKDVMADVFSYLEPERQQFIIESISDAEVCLVIDEMFLDDAVDFLEEVPANVVKKVLRVTDAHTRALIRQFLKYPKNSAGALMTVELVELHDRWTVGQALEHVRKTGPDKETIYTCYVIDDVHHLVGYVPLRHLITANEDACIRDIMEERVISVHTNVDQEEVALITSKYDLMSMPVVDTENRLVGLITVDDIVDVIQEENTEDIEKMAGITPSEKEYLRTGVFSMVKNRLPWLLLLMLSATLTGSIISYYENMLEALVVLTSFIPMLMSTGGNGGAQASAMVTRGLALGEIEPRDVFRVMLKELRVSMLCAVFLGGINFVRIMVFQPQVDVRINLTVALSLCCTVIFAKLIGGMLPLAAKRLGLDPAVMAAPMITTLVDSGSLAIFFNLSMALLNI